MNFDSLQSQLTSINGYKCPNEPEVNSQQNISRRTERDLNS